MSVSSVDVDHLYYKVLCLGDRAVPHNNFRNTQNKVQPIKFAFVYQEKFNNIVAQHEPPALSADVHKDVSSVCGVVRESRHADECVVGMPTQGMGTFGGQWR